MARAANQAKAKAPESVSMWPASAINVSDPAHHPPNASRTMKTAISQKVIKTLVWLAAGSWWAWEWA